MNEPTGVQKKEFWERCGVKRQDLSEYGRLPYRAYPDIDLNNLFEHAVPLAIGRLEESMTVLTHTEPQANKIRGIGLLFEKWLNKIREGYSLEDALFWAISEVFNE